MKNKIDNNMNHILEGMSNAQRKFNLEQDLYLNIKTSYDDFMEQIYNLENSKTKTQSFVIQRLLRQIRRIRELINRVNYSNFYNYGTETKNPEKFNKWVTGVKKSINNILEDVAGYEMHLEADQLKSILKTPIFREVQTLITGDIAKKYGDANVLSDKIIDFLINPENIDNPIYKKIIAKIINSTMKPKEFYEFFDTIQNKLPKLAGVENLSPLEKKKRIFVNLNKNFMQKLEDEELIRGDKIYSKDLPRAQEIIQYMLSSGSTDLGGKIKDIINSLSLSGDEKIEVLQSMPDIISVFPDKIKNKDKKDTWVEVDNLLKQKYGDDYKNYILNFKSQKFESLKQYKINKKI